MDASSGERIEIEVTNVAHGGVFVARHEGRVVFVADAVPGERVLALVADDSRSAFWRAQTVEVLRASPHRRPQVWAEASIERPPGERVGGADFGHIELGHQRELKSRVLADALARMAGVEPEVVVEPVPDPEAEPPAQGDRGLGYRTRVRLHVAADGTPGPYAARSHRVIRVGGLPLATAEVAAAAPLTGRFPGASAIDIVAPGRRPALVLVTGARRGKRPRPVTVTQRVHHRDFRLDARGFWQVHRGAAEVLASAVRSAIAPDLFDPRAANLDLYGGVGLFAAAMADGFGPRVSVVSVESDRVASGHAAANLAEWAGVSAVADRVDRYLRRLGEASDAAERTRLAAATVVLDPPRAGAGAPAIEALAALRPAQVVYVACDPVALARDVALLQGRGYALTGLRAFDLFPNTHHVEAVASLICV
jgi:tRNA/tmRNA/rRNA uracil-C5-methylase (TrmA/RlmC/RlmD family)